MKIFEFPRTSKKVHVGDVIMSQEFENGHQRNTGDLLFVGGTLRGNFPDPSRAQAKYIVIDAVLTSDPHGVSSWPNGWRIIARRLTPQDTDNGKGETIIFYQFFYNGDSNCGLIEEVFVVGTMEQRFV